MQLAVRYGIECDFYLNGPTAPRSASYETLLVFKQCFRHGSVFFLYRLWHSLATSTLDSTNALVLGIVNTCPVPDCNVDSPHTQRFKITVLVIFRE